MDFSAVDFEIKTHYIESRKKIRVLWGNFLTHVTEKGLESGEHKDILLIDGNRGKIDRRIDREASSSKMEDMCKAEKHCLRGEPCSVAIVKPAMKGNFVRGCHSGPLERLLLCSLQLGSPRFLLCGECVYVFAWSLGWPPI